MLGANTPLDGQWCVSAVRAILPGVCFGVRWGEHCQSSVLSPQTGNVSAVINVRSGRIVGSLDVGRYRGEHPLTGPGVAGGVPVLGAKDREGVGRSQGCGLGVEGMSWGWRERDLHGH